jgi:hypothetical protein
MGFSLAFKGLITVITKYRLFLAVLSDTIYSVFSNFIIFIVFFFWVIPRLLNFMCRRFGTLCSIFIGRVNKKNNWNENAWLFIRTRTGLVQNKSGPIGRRRGREGVCLKRVTGCGGTTAPKWRPVVKQEYVGEKAPYRSEDLDCLISFPTFRHACRS